MLLPAALAVHSLLPFSRAALASSLRGPSSRSSTSGLDNGWRGTLNTPAYFPYEAPGSPGGGAALPYTFQPGATVGPTLPAGGVQAPKYGDPRAAIP